MTQDELKSVIRNIHEHWYSGDFRKNFIDAIDMQKSLSLLFDFAGITSTSNDVVRAIKKMEFMEIREDDNVN